MKKSFISTYIWVWTTIDESIVFDWVIDIVVWGDPTVLGDNSVTSVTEIISTDTNVDMIWYGDFIICIGDLGE